MQVEELNSNSDSSIAELGRTLREIAYHIQARLEDLIHLIDLQDDDVLPPGASTREASLMPLLGA